MTDEKSLSEQIREITERFLQEMSRVMRDAQAIDDERNQERVSFAEKEAAWKRQESLLLSSARAAEQREGKAQDQLEWERHRHANEMQSAGDEISRLRGLIDVGMGAFQAAQEGVSIAKRLSEGQPAFEPAVARSNRGGGYVYQSVLADAQENMQAVNRMDDPMAALLDIAKRELIPDPESNISVELMQKIEDETRA